MKAAALLALLSTAACDHDRERYSLTGAQPTPIESPLWVKPACVWKWDHETALAPCPESTP